MLMVPVVLVAMILVVQFGLAYHARQVVAGAVQDGAAVAARRGASVEAGVQTADQLIATSAGRLLVDHSVTATSTGDLVSISASGEVVRLLPVLPTIRVQATGTASVEQFRPQGVSP